MLRFMLHARDHSFTSPSQVIRMHRKQQAAPAVAAATEAGEAGASSAGKAPVSSEWELSDVYMSDGSSFSGSSVGAPFKDRVLVGAVFADGILDCQIA